MSLTDLMSGMKLTVFPQIALVIFVVTFIAIIIRVICYPRAEITHNLNLPLSDEHTAAQRPAHGEHAAGLTTKGGRHG